jgi:hypothetical protein
MIDARDLRHVSGRPRPPGRLRPSAVHRGRSDTRRWHPGYLRVPPPLFDLGTSSPASPDTTRRIPRPCDSERLCTCISPLRILTLARFSSSAWCSLHGSVQACRTPKTQSLLREPHQPLSDHVYVVLHPAQRRLRARSPVASGPRFDNASSVAWDCIPERPSPSLAREIATFRRLRLKTKSTQPAHALALSTGYRVATFDFSSSNQFMTIRISGAADVPVVSGPTRPINLPSGMMS